MVDLFMFRDVADKPKGEEGEDGEGELHEEQQEELEKAGVANAVAGNLDGAD